MMLRERAVRRPNGKIYVPRKGLEVVGFVGHHYYPARTFMMPGSPGFPPHEIKQRGYHDHEVQFTAVLRTHDIDEAREFIGDARFLCEYLHDPQLQWLSLNYHYGELTWLDNPRHGMPCVVFREEDYPETPDTKEN